MWKCKVQLSERREAVIYFWTLSAQPGATQGYFGQ